MPEVTYYGHWICPFAKRVKFALAHRGIEHDEITIAPSAVRPKDFVLPPEFIKWSPKREIPMIRYRNEYKPDSIPILEFLEEKFSNDPLLPTDPKEKEFVRERVRWMDGNIMLNTARLYYGTRPEGIASAGEQIGKAFETVEGWLSKTPWAGGDAPTLADVILIPIYVRLEGLRQLGFNWNGPGPHVKAHIARCEGLKGWPAVAWSREQTDEFVGRFRKYREIAARKRAAEQATIR